ncbi:MAG: hypothetical protein KAQ98_05680 [Bacteriovoracaceae bacterium]|nr:hypothetical protein [Bacteriovoracaceae bacterium]
MKLILSCIIFILLTSCATTYHIGSFKLIQKEQTAKKINTKSKTPSKGEACNWSVFLLPTWKNHQIEKSINNTCPNSNSIKNVKIYEKIHFYLFYNELCTVTEGECLE